MHVWWQWIFLAMWLFFFLTCWNLELNAFYDRLSNSISKTFIIVWFFLFFWILESWEFSHWQTWLSIWETCCSKTWILVPVCIYTLLFYPLYNFTTSLILRTLIPFAWRSTLNKHVGPTIHDVCLKEPVRWYHTEPKPCINICADGFFIFSWWYVIFFFFCRLKPSVF